MLVCVHVRPQRPQKDTKCPAVTLHLIPLGQSFSLNSQRGWPASGIPGSYCLYPSHQGGFRHSWPCLVFHVLSGGAFKSSYHQLISLTPEKQSCNGHYINIDGIYTLRPPLNAKNQLKSHINKGVYFIILSVEVAIRDGIAGSIHHAAFITTECCSVFKRLRDGKLELSSSARFCCMRITSFIEVYT